MSEHKHADHLPWRVEYIASADYYKWRVVDMGDQVVGYFSSCKYADTLVRIVNSHAAIVEALEHVCFEIDRDMGLFDTEKIVDALALAQEPKS